MPLALAATLAVALTCSGCAGQRSRPHAATHVGRTTVPAAPGAPDRVSAPGSSHSGRSIPRDFLGLSFEVGDLPRLGSYAGRGDLAALLRSLGSGVLRLGGVTADTLAAWSPGTTPLPHWARTRITPADLAAIARLARATGWRVLLTVNLGHYDPQSAAAEVRAARSMLGGALAGVELGNEPDSFVAQSLRGPGWGFAQYRPQVAAYRSAIRAVAPDVALAGPDAVNARSGLPWVRAEAASVRPALLTDHYYPLGRCSREVPLIGDLLGAGVRRDETLALARMRSVSQRSGIPLRVDETNNVACGGQAGVSNTFAAALWALDFIMRAMGAGVAGVNFHGNPANPSGYAPLAAASARALVDGHLSAQPEFYALLLARRVIGDRFTRTVSPPGLTGSVTTLSRPGGGRDVVIVNEAAPGRGPYVARFPAPPHFAGGTVLRLLAPAPSAQSGVRLGGSSVTADGSWRPAGRLPRVAEHAGSVTVTVVPSSAALVTLSARR
jgi:hypothetical protein